MKTTVVKNDFHKLAGGLRPKARKAVIDTVAEIKQGAAATAPRDTGRLANSIKGQTHPVFAEGEVFTDVFYGWLVEYVNGQPFLTPPSEGARPRFEARMGRILED